jgi:NitT/TauT family transport system substrate-binding protein
MTDHQNNVRRPGRRRILRAVTAGLLVLAAAACSDDQPATGTAALETVTYLTGAGVLGREAYIYVAIDKGYFRQAGFDVQVQPGLGTEQNLKILRSGKADFAVVDITAALIAYGRHTFTDFTVVSAIQQRNLSCIMALPGHGISHPADLTGKKIAYIPGGVVYALFGTYAKLAGFSPAGIRWVAMQPAQMPQNLASGSIDAATQFVVGAPGVAAASRGRRQPVVLPFSDYLSDLYGSGVAVGKQALADNPDRVKKFNGALLQGLTYAMDHPAEAGQIYATHQHTQPPGVAAAENTLMNPYVRAGGAPIGTLDPSRAARNIAILQGAGVIPGGLVPTDAITFNLAGTG